MKKLVSALLVLVMLAGSAAAHVDRRFRVDPDGTIPEIPSRFGNVTLKIEWPGTGKPFIQLNIGMHQTIVPGCVARKIYDEGFRDIDVGGSLDGGGMGPYLGIKFFKPGVDPQASFSPHYIFVFDLDDAQLVYGRKFHTNGNSGQNRSLELPKGCSLKMLY